MIRLTRTRLGQDLKNSFSRMSFRAEMTKRGQILQKPRVPPRVPLPIPPTTTLTSEQGWVQRLQSRFCLILRGEANRLDVEHHTAPRAGLDSQMDWIIPEFPREVLSPFVE